MVTTTLRQACAAVAERARHVRIERERIAEYAALLIPGAGPPGGASPGPDVVEAGERERAAAFSLTLDAINFGSGWFPTLRKRAQPTGYRTIEAGVKHRFDESGPWTASELETIEPAELARLMGQDPEHELMGLFARSLRDLAEHLTEGYGGSFIALVDGADSSALRLVETLGGWGCFADTSSYGELRLPFLKRAQIAAADLHRTGVASFDDLAALTMFADNLVPHVLRLDRILRFAPDLVDRIDAGVLIEHGSAEEVEIRACAVQAVELIVTAAPVAVTPAEVDEILWNRGQQAAYKAEPRHRSCTTAY